MNKQMFDYDIKHIQFIELKLLSELLKWYPREIYYRPWFGVTLEFKVMIWGIGHQQKYMLIKGLNHDGFLHNQ